MWYLDQTPRRRRLLFDPLEDRRLLSDGLAPISPWATASIPAVPSGYREGPPGTAGQAESPPASAGVMAVSWETYPGDPSGIGPAHPGSFLPISSYRADRGPMPREGSFSSGAPDGFAPGPASTRTQPTTFAFTFSFFASNNHGSWPLNGDGYAGTPGGGAPARSTASTAPSPLGASGWDAGPGPGGFDAGDAHPFAGPQDGAPPPGAANASLNPLEMLAAMLKGRPEPPDAAAAVDVLGTMAGAEVPGLQAGAMVGANPAPAANPAAVSAANAATISAIQGMNPQGPPAGAAGQLAPHAVANDGDSWAGDRAMALTLGSGAGGAPRRMPALRHSLDPGGSTRSPADGASVAAEMPVDGLDAALTATRRADLIAESLPMVGDSLQRGLEDFVNQLEAVDVPGIVAQGPPPAITATIAVIGAATTSMVVREVARRKSSRRDGRGVRIVDPFGRELALSFPELPRSWSRRY